MEHKSIEDLRDVIHTASYQVEIGGHYIHYKNQHLYIALGFVVLESTDEIGVRYADVNEPAIEFVRLLSSWIATIDGSPRFRPQPSID